MLSPTIFFYATLATSAFISLASAACPNRCSGHGSCGTFDKCTCHPGFIGGDCSLRTCPHSRAWVDTAQATDDAHYWAECGNKGTCDRSSGECECDEGFTGVGCRRMACPNDCSGHGTCEFIEEIAGDTYDKRIGVTTAVTYTLWDQEKIMGCKCDPWYEGHDCSSRMCPRGDDPVTTTVTRNMIQVLSFGTVAVSSNHFSLTYYDPYGNAWTTHAIARNGDSSIFCLKVQEALRALPNHALDEVNVYDETGTGYAFGAQNVVTRHTLDETEVKGTITAETTTLTSSHGVDGNMCWIEFPHESGTTGVQNLLSCRSGNQASAIGFQPVLAGTTAETCTVYEWASSTEASAAKLPLTENAECSNRGLCDSSSGTCDCFEGHTGLACEIQEALV